MNNATENMTKCPDWCTLEADHDWDGEHPDGSVSRGHAGPRFGKYVGVEAWESSALPGKILPIASVDTDGKDLDRDDLINVATAAIEAAAWLRDVGGVEL